MPAPRGGPDTETWPPNPPPTPLPTLNTPTMTTPTLYHHPIATTCRPILMFAAEEALVLDLREVDLLAGEHLSPAFSRLNPNQAVPVLVEGAFVLTESSAILKYLAKRCGSAAYPALPHARAQVNAWMDWVNTGLMRDLAYGVAYPQVFAHHRRPDAAAQQATLDWHWPRVERWLDVLDDKLRSDGRRFLTGPRITLADYFALGPLQLLAFVDADLRRWSALQRWLDALAERPAFGHTHRAFQAFVTASRAGRRPRAGSEPVAA